MKPNKPDPSRISAKSHSIAHAFFCIPALSSITDFTESLKARAVPPILGPTPNNFSSHEKSQNVIIERGRYIMCLVVPDTSPVLESILRMENRVNV